MKKRVSVILLAVLCLCSFALVGCEDASAKAPFEVTVEEAFICNTYNGEVLVVNLDVTNTSKDYVNVGSIVYEIGAKLDGTSLKPGYLPDSSDNFISIDAKIAAGEKGKAQAIFELSGETEGEVILTGVTYTVNYEKQVEFLNETIDFSTLEKKVSESKYKLTIDNVLKTDDGDGKDIIVIDMTFANNSEEAASFGYAVSLEIFQNGTALKSGYLPYKHPSYDEELEGNNYLDIKGGNEIKVRKVLTLNDENEPIEVKAIDNGSFDVGPLLEVEIQIN